MAADLFETYAITAIAAMLLGSLLFEGHVEPIIYPLALGAVSIIASIIGTFFVRLVGKSIMGALYFGLIGSGIIAAVGFYWVTNQFFGNPSVGSVYAHGTDILTIVNPQAIFFTSLIGLFVTLGMVLITEFYTSKRFGPVKNIASSVANSDTGGTFPTKSP